MMDDPPLFKSFAVMKKSMDAILNDRLRDVGLTASLGPFILNLSHDEGISHKELTERVCVNKSLTTRAVKILFDEGYAENRNTGKEYSIYLTEKGEEARERVREKMTDLLKSLLSTLTPEEMDMMKIIDAKIHDRIEVMLGEIKGEHADCKICDLDSDI